GIYFQCFLVGVSFASEANGNFVENIEDNVSSSTLALQQRRVITGKVLDENSQGLPGVNVLIKGTNTGTVTNVDGMYTIEVPSSESTIVFSSIGYTSQEIQVGAQSVVNVSMDVDVQTLGEIVIVGYGEQK